MVVSGMLSRFFSNDSDENTGSGLFASSSCFFFEW